ncbi:hypothetical protein HKBW3S03_01366 [Candidatus Hakubella thermalkaliphila]|uniref:Uncharacterized protein n=1 Tax=Candidatus Hakubella thermalkaliphila TaxID=2754717 RepID=A0A6V8NHS6_9ACTN|nr:hypothetical protein [Candidatus Hakubella thermalkaliphila]GFP19862.1 hypothetical protein HKBW3S03_01366 [Candidatus Hakubella thermalkaliphila]
MIVVSNATVLIGLAKIGKLDLLPGIFSKVYIPEEVFKELVPERSKKPGSWEIEKAEWLEMRPNICLPSSTGWRSQQLYGLLSQNFF